MKVQELIKLFTNECDPNAEIHVYTEDENGPGSAPVIGVDPYDTVTMLVTEDER